MRIPAARGPVSQAVVGALRAAPHDPGEAATLAAAGAAGRTLGDEDLQVSLWTCYELHYRGFAGVDEDWEWQPGLLALRASLETAFERDLRALVRPRLPAAMVTPADLPDALTALVAADDGPPLARHVQRRATLEQVREFVALRSVYHLKEADPHTWGIPRLDGRAKAALVEIQADEYGGGRPGRMHAELFAATMRELGLDDTYGAYVDPAPAWALAVSNAMSLFGLHRRLRAALVGHLAAFEMTSSLPNRRYGNALRRLGFGPVATRFYDEHVEADAVHEQVAMHDLCVGFAAADPGQAAEVLFGAACALALDGVFARHLLSRWGEQELGPAQRAAEMPA